MCTRSVLVSCRGWGAHLQAIRGGLLDEAIQVRQGVVHTRAVLPQLLGGVPAAALILRRHQVRTTGRTHRRMAGSCL